LVINTTQAPVCESLKTTAQELTTMAAKPPAKKKGRRRRKMRLTLKQKKMDTATDSYTDSLGWSTDVGRTLGDAPKEAEPEFINVQCEMCGSMMKARKPRKTRYTITCDYPACGHTMDFS